jgi:hypothetical protein
VKPERLQRAIDAEIRRFACTANWSRSTTSRMDAWGFAGKAGLCRIRSSTNCNGSVMPPSLRTNVWVRFSPGSRSSRTDNPASVAFRQGHGAQTRRPVQSRTGPSGSSKPPNQSEISPQKTASLRYDGRRSAVSRPLTGRLVTFQLCRARHSQLGCNNGCRRQIEKSRLV